MKLNKLMNKTINILFTLVIKVKKVTRFKYYYLFY